MPFEDTPSFSDQQIRQGEELLKTVLPEAREQAKHSRAEAVSSLATAMRPYVTEANMRALVIHPGRNGGWLADLMFADVPDGIADIIGTPVAHPAPTQAAALQEGIQIISTALALSARPVSGETTAPAFLYYDAPLAVFPEILRRLDQHGARTISADYAYRRLGEVTRLLFADRLPTAEAFTQLTVDQQKQLIMTIHMASLIGVLRYPPVTPGAPVDRCDDDINESCG